MFSNLAPGEYQLTAELDGFSPVNRKVESWARRLRSGQHADAHGLRSARRGRRHRSREFRRATGLSACRSDLGAGAAGCAAERSRHDAAGAARVIGDDRPRGSGDGLGRWPAGREPASAEIGHPEHPHLDEFVRGGICRTVCRARGDHHEAGQCALPRRVAGHVERSGLNAEELLRGPAAAAPRRRTRVISVGPSCRADGAFWVTAATGSATSGSS